MGIAAIITYLVVDRVFFINEEYYYTSPSKTPRGMQGTLKSKTSSKNMACMHMTSCDTQSWYVCVLQKSGSSFCSSVSIQYEMNLGKDSSCACVSKRLYMTGARSESSSEAGVHGPLEVQGENEDKRTLLPGSDYNNQHRHPPAFRLIIITDYPATSSAILSAPSSYKQSCNLSASYS